MYHSYVFVGVKSESVGKPENFGVVATECFYYNSYTALGELIVIHFYFFKRKKTVIIGSFVYGVHNLYEFFIEVFLKIGFQRIKAVLYILYFIVSGELYGRQCSFLSDSFGGCCGG